MNQGKKISKIFGCLFLFACFATSGCHVTNFMRYQATRDTNVPNCQRTDRYFEDVFPSTPFNSTYLYSIEMCFTIAGEYGTCNGATHLMYTTVGGKTFDGIGKPGQPARHPPAGYSTVPNGITTETCFFSYACQWSTSYGVKRNNFDLNPVGFRYYGQYLDIPPGTPVDYLMQAATYKIETTGDIYLPDGHRVFDFHCSLDDCQITADTENGGSGTFENRIIIKKSANAAKAAECLGNAATLKSEEIYLITFTCNEFCPEKLTVKGKTKQ